MLTVSPIEFVLMRDRAIVVASIVVLVVLAWVYLAYLARNASAMDMGTGMGMSMAAPNMQPWGAVDWGSMFLMWAVMMVAMMVPTAAPMVLVFAAVNRRRREQNDPYVPTAIFLLGYALVWTGFAAAATALNWALHTHALLSSMMGVSTSNYLGGALLVAAGIFQWTPLKYACLSHCRSPLGFLMTEWRDGASGALRMGLKHGGYCLGCCWLLMALLFVLGVMNLVWVGVLAGFVLLEKIVPAGHWLSRASGLALAAWGGLVITQVMG